MRSCENVGLNPAAEGGVMEAKSCFAESFWGTCFGPHREERGGVGSFSYLFEGTYAFFLKKYFYCKKKKKSQKHSVGHELF